MLPAAIGKQAGDTTTIHPSVINHADPTEAAAERPVGGQWPLHVVCGNYPDKIEGDVLNEMSSQRITQIGGSGAYNNGLNSFKSYNEEKDGPDYAKKVIGNVMKGHLLKAPITIKVSGVGFLKPKTNMTLGNTLRIYFLANKPADRRATTNWDLKRSGDYLIYATKHSFTVERYDISITCAKMKNFTTEAAIV